MPIVVEPILAHAGPLVLVIARLGGLAVFAPMLSSTVVPLKVRALLVVVLSASIYPTVPGPLRPVALDLASLGPAIFLEALIGLSIGLLAALPMYGVQLAGMMMGQQLGFGLAGIYNPALETESDVLGELLLNMALATFVAIGGLESLFLALATTFATVPLGGAGLESAPLDLTVGLVSCGFELALRVAAPLLGILLIETLATGYLMKTIPQINIMSIGFAVKVLAGLGVLVGAIYAIDGVIGEELVRCGRVLQAWVESL